MFYQGVDSKSGPQLRLRALNPGATNFDQFGREMGGNRVCCPFANAIETLKRYRTC